jgi:hypothetical protein
MVTMVTRHRGESPARWQQALTRALDNGIEAFRIAGTGAFVVTSATKLDTVYRTDGVVCECPAALAGDMVCTHRAVVRTIQGRLDAALPRACVWCGGSGWVADPECRQAPELCSCPRHRDSDNDPTEDDIAVALADADAAYQEYQALVA